MKDQKYYNNYKAFVNQVVTELPEGLAPLGDFVLTWSPVIMLLIAFTKLIDLLFKQASTKFIANGFVSLCKLMWNEAFKEPKHKGLLVEAPIRVQILVHQVAACVHTLLGIFTLLFTFIALYVLITLNIKPELFIEGIIVLSFLSAAGLFLSFIQFGLAHQSIKLAKSLKSN
ncbi:hypothetical protein AWH60_06125 [Pseudoalteromonas haloplanktis]|nr:hypothetical protein AWH60_06125 [Pseudoalteromonas haloplanktis]